MFRWVASVTTPLQVTACHLALDDVFDHTSRQQRVELALEERQVDVETILRNERVVEDGLLVSLAPAMGPVIVHSLHIHPALV